MYLCDGKIGNEYKVEDIDLPVNIEKRLEALGMTRGTSIAVLNSKSRGVLIVKVRGTRFALGRNITKKMLFVNPHMFIDTVVSSGTCTHVLPSSSVYATPPLYFSILVRSVTDTSSPFSFVSHTPLDTYPLSVTVLAR